MSAIYYSYHVVGVDIYSKKLYGFSLRVKHNEKWKKNYTKQWTRTFSRSPEEINNAKWEFSSRFYITINLYDLKRFPSSVYFFHVKTFFWIQNARLFKICKFALLLLLPSPFCLSFQTSESLRCHKQISRMCKHSIITKRNSSIVRRNWMKLFSHAEFPHAPHKLTIISWTNARTMASFLCNRFIQCTYRWY